MYGRKTEEVTGIWRKLRSQERHNFCSVPDLPNHQIKMDGVCRTCGERANTCSAAFVCGDRNEGNHVVNLDVQGKLMSVQK